MTSTRDQHRRVSKPRHPRPARPSAKPQPAVEPPAAEASPSSRTLLQLQGMAGNAAVSALIAGGLGKQAVQRLAGRQVPPPPQAPAPPAPSEHPGFQATQSRVSVAGRRAAAHPGAKSKAAEAAKAAKPPADDKEAQGKTAQAGEMGTAPAGTFDKAAFIAAVSAAIAKQAPKNLDEADKLATSGKSDTIAAEIKGKVSASKDASAKPMEEASAKTPDTSAAKEKRVTPLPGPSPAAAPTAIDAAAAMPAKAPAAQTELGAAPAETDQKMAEADISEEQLATSNEPEFTGALAAKKEGEQHSASAPAAFRESESQKLGAAKQGAQAAEAETAADLVRARSVALQQVGGGQQQAESKDEQDRAMVSGKIKSIFDATKTEVDAILKGLDPLVDKQFTDGEARAKAAFTADHTARMEKYKDERYSGVSGWARWTADLFTGLPPEANQIFQLSKKVYESQMAAVISSIADTVGRELTRAKDRIAQGRKQIATYVNGLDPSLKSIGNEAAKQISSQFDSLEESVNEKSSALVDDLAEKYVAARNAVDDEIKAMQEENKGLWDKAKDAIGGAIETILKLKNMLLGVLSRAVGAVEKIIRDPIGFLGNFINAVKTGVMNFGANILEHLKKGLQSWLFGALAEAGIEIPEKFDLKGIVGLILSLLGLTWASIRARLAKVLPEWVLKALETAVEVVKILTTEGVSGLWKWIVQKITDLKDRVFGQIKEFVVTKIITAGITFLISLLNPAAAFIKACKMIYDAVMWFVDNAERLKDFVDSVLESVESIAAGGVGKVASIIEATLGKAVPMVISGLASLLGLGGIADKIKKILQAIQKPVGKVVDSIINGVVKYGKGMLKKLGKTRLGKRSAELVKRGRKGVVAAKKWAKEKARQVGEALGIIKKSFAAGGESHTLSVDTRTGQIRMASTVGPAESKVRAYVERRNASRKEAGLPPLPVDGTVSAVVAQIKEATARIQGVKKGKTATARAQLDQLAIAITDLLAKIGGGSTNRHADRPSGLGQIAPHGDQASSNRNDPSENRWLESEHVLPVRVVSLLLEQLGEVLPIKRGSSEDRRQHTIMIYKGAANLKTRGTESADYNLINQLKSIARTGMARLEGRGIMARRISELSPEQRKRLKEEASKKAVDVKESLGSKLPAVMAARIGATTRAIQSDQSDEKQKAEKAADRGHAEALPTEEKVRTAAAAQATDIVEILAERIDPDML